MKRYIVMAAAALALAASSGAAASTSTIPTVKIHCAYIQGGSGVSVGDLNVHRKGAVKRFCFVGKRGVAGADGARGPVGPAGPAGSVGATVAVCASNGGNLKLCGGDNGHSPVGYLVLTGGR